MSDANLLLTRFDDSGKITCAVTVPATMRDLQGPNHIDGHHDTRTHYVLDGQAQIRPACPAALDGTTLRGVLVPSTLFINDRAFEVTSDTVELSFPNPGHYRLRLVAWPCLDGNFEVET